MMYFSSPSFSSFSDNLISSQRFQIESQISCNYRNASEKEYIPFIFKGVNWIQNIKRSFLFRFERSQQFLKVFKLPLI